MFKQLAEKVGEKKEGERRQREKKARVSRESKKKLNVAGKLIAKRRP